MKTLVFCTSFFDNKELYLKRYKKWIDYYSSHHLMIDKHFFLIDDSSNLDLIHDPKINIYIENKKIHYRESNKITIFSFNDRKGQNWSHNSANNEGWWRSFCMSIKIAEIYGFSKIVHIESDAFLISNRVMNYINNLEEGWVALWANKYYFPESSIQVICNDQFDNFNNFISCGYQELSKKGYAEEILPFTHVERGFLGDRFGEKYLNQIYGVDYICQVKNDVNIVADGMNEFPSSFTIDLWRFSWKFKTVQLFWSYRYFVLVCLITLLSFISLCNII